MEAPAPAHLRLAYVYGHRAHLTSLWVGEKRDLGGREEQRTEGRRNGAFQINEQEKQVNYFNGWKGIWLFITQKDVQCVIKFAQILLLQ